MRLAAFPLAGASQFRHKDALAAGHELRLHACPWTAALLVAKPQALRASHVARQSNLGATPVTMQQTAGIPVDFAPIIDLPFVEVDLGKINNPIPIIFNDPRFNETIQFFAEAPSATRSLLTPKSQALLYTIIRNLRPTHIVEIGTYKGGTSESMVRALLATGLENDF